MKQILVTGGAGFIGSNLTLTLQEKYPEAVITVLDDFRSGDFHNLEGFRGDVVAKDMATLDFEGQFRARVWDAVFHLASITDTTEHRQRLQVEDNVEGFRRLLEFVRPHRTPVVYATSAATYGIAGGVNRLKDPRCPANVYAFSKVQLENLARLMMGEEPGWKITGFRYFNVYGPRETHKGVPASMILHLARQMKQGHRPRIFRMGEQKRDFVYVKDVVRFTMAGLGVEHPGVFNLGSSQPRSFNDLVTVLNQVLGTHLEPDYIDNPHAHYQPHTEADMSETIAATGIRPEFSLEDGVRDYLESGWLLP